MLKQNVFNITL